MLAFVCLAKQAGPTHSTCLLHAFPDRFVGFLGAQGEQRNTPHETAPLWGRLRFYTPVLSRQSRSILDWSTIQQRAMQRVADSASFPRNLVDKTRVNIFTVRTGGVDCHIHVSYTGAALRGPSPGRRRRHKCSRCSVGCGSDGSSAAPRRASVLPDAEPLYTHLKHYHGPLT